MSRSLERCRPVRRMSYDADGFYLLFNMIYIGQDDPGQMQTIDLQQ